MGGHLRDGTDMDLPNLSGQKISHSPWTGSLLGVQVGLALLKPLT